MSHDKASDSAKSSHMTPPCIPSEMHALSLVVTPTPQVTEQLLQDPQFSTMASTE